MIPDGSTWTAETGQESKYVGDYNGINALRQYNVYRFTTYVGVHVWVAQRKGQMQLKYCNIFAHFESSEDTNLIFTVL